MNPSPPTPVEQSALVIVGKCPEPGRTKSRLSPPLSARQATDLYAGFLRDTVALALGLGWDCTTLIYPPRPGAEAGLRALLPACSDGGGDRVEEGAAGPGHPCIHLRAQAGDGLGEALAGAFATHLAEGFDRVVLIGSDNPSLPAELVEAARRGLGDHDLVIGPSTDGGYYLIGMRQPHLRIFEHITWSTEVVYGQTLAQAAALGLRVQPLPEWYDVDTAAELRRLREDLADQPDSVAPATRAILAGLTL